MQFSHACFNVSLNRVQEILHEWVLVVILFTILNIMKICPCNEINECSFIPHFYLVKMGFTGVYLLFLFLLQNIDCGYWELVPTIYILSNKSEKNFQ